MRGLVWVARFGSGCKLVAEVEMDTGNECFGNALKHLRLRDVQVGDEGQTTATFTDNGDNDRFWDWWWTTQECPEGLFEKRMAPFFQAQLEKERELDAIYSREWRE